MGPWMVLGVKMWMVKKLGFRTKGLGLPSANWVLLGGSGGLGK